MASAPSEPRPVLGRLDRSGRLVSADPQLEALQREAGSAIGQPLALPQIAAVAQLARKLRTAVSRPAIAFMTPIRRPRLIYSHRREDTAITKSKVFPQVR